MTERVDRFCDDLRTRLNGVEDQLQRVKSSLASAQEESREALQTKLSTVKQRIDARRQEVEEAKTSFDRWVEEKEIATAGKIDSWLANKEVEQLGMRADSAEVYAASAIVLALAAVEEAELATLEAVEARLVAEEAASTLI
jgi:hypothetical protein